MRLLFVQNYTNEIVVNTRQASKCSDTIPQFFDAAIAIVKDTEALRPDLIIYIGGTIVSKTLQTNSYEVAHQHILY